MPQKLPTAAFRDVPALGRRVSRVGFGGYRIDDRSEVHREALVLALRAGVNLVDTSTNYGDGRSEILVGRTLRDLASEIPREDVVVVTKAGYVQGSNQREAIARSQAGRPWTEMTEYAPDCWHCISPGFLRDQLAASLGRLGLAKVDVLLLHNPEYFLSDGAKRGVPKEEARARFYDRAARAFTALEEEVASGRIGAYGVSSNTFVVPHDRKDAVDLSRLLELAGPGFKVVQLPMNPLEMGARDPHHTPGGRSVLEVARDAGLAVLLNRPLNAFGGGGLVRFARSDVPFEPEPAKEKDAWAALGASEAAFRANWAPRLALEGREESPAEILELSPLLAEVRSRVRDLVTFGEVWDSWVAPRLEDLLPQVETALAADPAFPSWAASYRLAVRQVATAVAAPLLAKEEKRVASLDRTLVDLFGPAGGRTVSQRAIRGLADAPGVDVVLVGMRRERYVEDVVGAFL